MWLKTFKDIGFAIDVETNLKIVDFLDNMFNLNNDTYRPYKKPNDLFDFKLKFNKTSNNHTKRNCQLNIIWFNPPFSRAVSTIAGKRFLQL